MCGIFLPENDALQVEGVLYDSCSGDAHPEHILLRGKIVAISNTIQIGKITTGSPVEEKRDKDKTGKQLYKAWQAITPLPFQEVQISPVEEASQKKPHLRKKGVLVSVTAPPTLCIHKPMQDFDFTWHAF